MLNKILVDKSELLAATDLLSRLKYNSHAFGLHADARELVDLAFNKIMRQIPIGDESHGRGAFLIVAFFTLLGIVIGLGLHLL